MYGLSMTSNSVFLNHIELYGSEDCMGDRYNINWNYGLLPQTWEDPSHSNSDVENAFGDNDPGV
jgi:inorganic pyrophosphatase